MNSEVVLPLGKMTVAKKREVIERIMADFAKNVADFPLPGFDTVKY